MFKKLKNKLLYDFNYTNKFAYISLSIASISCLFGSLFFETDSKGFVILSAIGCSGIVSVIVAALVEKSNNRIQKKRDCTTRELLLSRYDFWVKMEMQRALLYCEYAYEIDFDGEYGISEIVRYLDELDFNNDYFREFPLLLESIIQDISAIKAWELQKGAGGWPLYSHLEELQKASHQMNNIVNKQQKISVLKMLVLSSIEIFDEINKIRNKNIKYSISKENDEWLKELRRSNSKNGEKINAQY